MEAIFAAMNASLAVVKIGPAKIFPYRRENKAKKKIFSGVIFTIA